tara:strand:- start:16381 stop:16665 length:285 start_codon:yes stop_codon:yes gene_type:complete
LRALAANVATVGVGEDPVTVALQSAIDAHTKSAFAFAGWIFDNHIFSFLVVEADVAGSLLDSLLRDVGIRRLSLISLLLVHFLTLSGSSHFLKM